MRQWGDIQQIILSLSFVPKRMFIFAISKK